MDFRRAIVNLMLKRLLDMLCRIDNSELFMALKLNKPLIIVINHTNFLEVPILVTHSYPLYLTGLVKAETWKNPIFAFLFNTYRAIPIDRNRAFKDAFKQVREAIDNGYFVAIAPEGTRSKNGILGNGKGGIIPLALEADVPVLPVVHCGGEQIWKNIRRFKRTPFYFKAGRPFRLKFDGRPDKEVREKMLCEVMGQIARLLPVEKRGFYAQQAESECAYLEFL
jgi:1-acyl-sn-glycerol-3-phosphate acyltransferase